MSKSLEQRLSDARAALGAVDGVATRHAGRLAAEVESQFRTIAAFASDVEHWKQMLTARGAARALLDNLEQRADQHDDVPYGSSTAKFQTVRLLGVQGYLAAQWALADRLVAMAGHVLCVRSSLQDPKNQPQLVSHFVGGRGPEARIAAILFSSLRGSFGWPIAISYALRNHFLHDGGGGDFFEGSNADSGFKISQDGWTRIEERVRSYAIDARHTRLGASWTASPGDDLRSVLDTCASEMDEALGVLLGSACRMAVVHLDFIVGED